MRIIIYLLAIFALDSSRDGVSLIFRNNSEVHINKIKFLNGRDLYTISNVKPGSLSQVVKVSRSYKRFYTLVETSTDTFMIHPIDHLGDSLYEFGAITIRTTIKKSSNGEKYCEIKAE